MTRARNAVGVLRLMGKEDATMLKSNRKRQKSASFVRSRQKSVIPEAEESVEISAIKGEYYDRNDPDVLRLKEFERNVRKLEQKEDHEFIKDVNDENEELYSGFANVKQNTESVKRRIIKSARTHDKQREEIGTYFAPIERPTTVSLAVVDEEYVNKKTAKRKAMKSAKLIKGGGFAIIGRASKLTPRTSLKEGQFISPCNGCTLIESQPSKKRLITSLTNLYNTVNSTKSILSEEDKRPIQQINLITDLQYDRPTTAITSTRQPPLSSRPMSAYIGSNAIKRIPMVVPITYMRPLAAHRRPISAAVNVQVSQAKGLTRMVNPKVAKKKYMKYLRELEIGAQQFIIEEDTGSKMEPLTERKGNVRTVKLKRN
jgi:hypothetical protein